MRSALRSGWSRSVVHRLLAGLVVFAPACGSGDGADESTEATGVPETGTGDAGTLSDGSGSAEGSATTSTGDEGTTDTSGDGDASGDGDGCDVCTVGDSRCDAIDPAWIETCEIDGTTGCAAWTPTTDCAITLSDPDGFCDATATPPECALPMPCSVMNPTVSFEPPNVAMVLDHSGSMYLNSIAPGVTRWDGLVQVVDSVTQAYEDRINFGIKWFPSSTTECTSMAGKCDVTSTFDVAPAPFNNGPIMTALNAMTNLGSCSTPTQHAMEQSTIALAGAVPPGEEGAFMLIVDGGVATFCSGNTHTGTVAAISDALGMGFPTYVVGIDAGLSADANDYAVAGGVPNPAPGVEYYPGEDLTALNDALDQIAGQIATCEIQLSTPSPNPELTEVSVDGVDFPAIDPADCGTSDGWHYTDASALSIMLCGAACDAFQASLVAEVSYFCVAG